MIKDQNLKYFIMSETTLNAIKKELRGFYDLHENIVNRHCGHDRYYGVTILIDDNLEFGDVDIIKELT